MPCAGPVPSSRASCLTVQRLGCWRTSCLTRFYVPLLPKPQVRKFTGWHHHMLTCMLAHFFLWHLKIRLEKKTPSITLPQLRVLISVILPMKRHTLETLLEQIVWVQIQNHRAYLSHRRRRILKLAKEP